MTTHFVYMWFDKARKMFYVGKHSGSFDDGYTTSNKWLAGEIAYRPADFKRRIIKNFDTENESQQFEGKLLTCIKPHEWGRKYYNSKQGKPKGVEPWNKGKVGVISDEHRARIAESRKGKPTTKGRKSPTSADNARKGSAKLSANATGRKKVIRDGKATWAHPGDVDYPTNSVTELVGHSVNGV